MSHYMKMPLGELESEYSNVDPKYKDDGFHEKMKDIIEFRKLGGTIKELNTQIKTFNHQLNREKYVKNGLNHPNDGY